MNLIVGRTYIGPGGRDYRLEAIEDRPGDVTRLVIRALAEGCGAIRFPAADAAKWLKGMIL